MQKKSVGLAVLFGGVLAAGACQNDGVRSGPPSNPNSVMTGPANVDGARIIAADREPQNWLSYGRDYGEDRFSPLASINDNNVGRLGLAWFVDLDTKIGSETTPLVVDGVMYSVGAVASEPFRQGQLGFARGHGHWAAGGDQGKSLLGYGGEECGTVTVRGA
jgi:glucose dehydrogenase